MDADPFMLHLYAAASRCATIPFPGVSTYRAAADHFGGSGMPLVGVV